MKAEKSAENTVLNSSSTKCNVCQRKNNSRNIDRERQKKHKEKTKTACVLRRCECVCEHTKNREREIKIESANRISNTCIGLRKSTC